MEIIWATICDVFFTAFIFEHNVQKMSPRDDSWMCDKVWLMSPCQGHAKLMRHTEVNLMDAVYAVVLLESSVEGGSWEVNAGNFFSSPKIGLRQNPRNG